MSGLRTAALFLAFRRKYALPWGASAALTTAPFPWDQPDGNLPSPSKSATAITLLPSGTGKGLLLTQRNPARSWAGVASAPRATGATKTASAARVRTVIFRKGVLRVRADRKS